MNELVRALPLEEIKVMVPLLHALINYNIFCYTTDGVDVWKSMCGAQQSSCRRIMQFVSMEKFFFS